MIEYNEYYSDTEKRLSEMEQIANFARNIVDDISGLRRALLTLESMANKTREQYLLSHLAKTEEESDEQE